jgi:serine protease
MTSKHVRAYRKSASVISAVALMIGCAASGAAFADDAHDNPYSPAYGHAYRHGVVPTREAWEHMKEYAGQNAGPGGAGQSKTLSYGGGIDGIGVTSGTPRVYLVVYGSQWGTAGTDANGNMTLSNDAHGAVPYLERMFKNIGTGGELWSGVMTQYCDGAVSAGATSCPSGASFVGVPTAGAFAGIWYDNSVASPSNATATQLGQEAVKAASHFSNTTAASNRYTQYVILSPSGTHPDGFNTSGSNFCAWHDWNGDPYVGAPSAVGDIAFTNMPYVLDLGASCGQNFVNSGSAGTLDGFSIVNGHEYSETITDQNPAGGWTNRTSGQENADECAWISSGQGASANVVMGTGTFAMQSTWSNDTNRCDISHPIVSGGGGGGSLTLGAFSYLGNHLSVTFTTGAASGGTTPYAYTWTFGDGSQAGSGSPVTHVYSKPGNYSVKETVTDKNGATASTTKNVSVKH